MVGFHIFPYPTRAGLSLIQPSPSFFYFLKLIRCVLVQTKPRRCRVKACALTADISSTPPAFLLAPHFVRAVGSLRRFVPSHIHMELLMYKIDLASYALTAGRTFGPPESVRLVRLGERRTFALSDKSKCRNAVCNQISKSLGTNLRFVPSPCQYNPYRLRQKIGDFLSSINNNYANEKY